MADRRIASYVKPCEENGVSHDCSHEYIHRMPVDRFEQIVAEEWKIALDDVRWALRERLDESDVSYVLAALNERWRERLPHGS